jgi:biotin carboxyl carrier protein
MAARQNQELNILPGGNQNIKEIFAPLNGKIVQLNFSKNDLVKSGDTLLVIESMKMENKITSSRDAEIETLNVEVGELVESNKLLITLK